MPTTQVNYLLGFDGSKLKPSGTLRRACGAAAIASLTRFDGITGDICPSNVQLRKLMEPAHQPIQAVIRSEGGPWDPFRD